MGGLIILLTIFAYFMLCIKIHFIGQEKGHNNYIWWALIFSPLVAIFLVIAEPDRNKIEK